MLSKQENKLSFLWRITEVGLKLARASG